MNLLNYNRSTFLKIITKYYLISLIILIVFAYNGHCQVFGLVGKKMSVSDNLVTEEYLKSIKVDSGDFLFHEDNYRIHCKIIELYYGDYKKDTITFETATIHNIKPYENLLLFLLKLRVNGEYHQIYQLPIGVYKTREKRWASPYIEDMRRYPKLKPQKIFFEQEVSYDIGNYSVEYIKKHYPTPYYEIRENKAVAIYGIDAEDLAIAIKEKYDASMLKGNKSK